MPMLKLAELFWHVRRIQVVHLVLKIGKNKD